MVKRFEHAVEVSKTSITTVAMLEMTQAGREMSDEELKENPAVEQEWVVGFGKYSDF